MAVRADRLDLAIVLALSIACGAIYAQTASFDFVGFDDEAHVTRNAITQGGFAAEGIVPALTTTVAANWHPLTQFSHMLDVELFGLEAGGHHVVNGLLHLLATLLVCLRITHLVAQNAHNQTDRDFPDRHTALTPRALAV